MLLPLLYATLPLLLATNTGGSSFEAEDAEMLLALKGLPQPGMHTRGKDVAQLVVTAQSLSADWVVLDGHGSVWQPGQACSSADGPGCLATAQFFRQRQRQRQPLVRPPLRVDIESAVEMVETMITEFRAEAVEAAGGTLSGGLGAESAEDLEAAHAAAAALTAAGVDTYHLSTWSSSDFYGETTEQVLLVKIQQHGGGPESPVILAAVKQSGDPRVPGAKR